MKASELSSVNTLLRHITLPTFNSLLAIPERR